MTVAASRGVRTLDEGEIDGPFEGDTEGILLGAFEGERLGVLVGVDVGVCSSGQEKRDNIM